MSAIRGFITNLGKYNEGELVGEWVDFPISNEDLQAALGRIGIGSTNEFGAPYEEYFFTDWELPEGVSWSVFGEYPDIEEVNEVAEIIDNSNLDENVISAIFDHASNLEEAKQIINDGNYMIYWGANDTRSLGEIAVDEIDGGVQNLPKEVLEQYFDYEAYGRNLETGSNITYFDGGAIEIY